jgi:hypothetical protein
VLRFFTALKASTSLSIKLGSFYASSSGDRAVCQNFWNQLCRTFRNRQAEFDPVRRDFTLLKTIDANLRPANSVPHIRGMAMNSPLCVARIVAIGPQWRSVCLRSYATLPIIVFSHASTLTSPRILAWQARI